MRLLIWFLVGLIVGVLVAPTRTDAQSPHLLFVAASSGAVPANGSTAGVLTVNSQ